MVSFRYVFFYNPITITLQLALKSSERLLLYKKVQKKGGSDCPPLFWSNLFFDLTYGWPGYNV